MAANECIQSHVSSGNHDQAQGIHAVSAGPQTIENDLMDSYVLIRGELEVAEAIAAAARVLFALERAPARHDNHPGHNIITGNGYAHGLRVPSDSLPCMLQHACHLIQSALDEADNMRATAADALRQIASERGAA